MSQHNCTVNWRKWGQDVWWTCRSETSNRHTHSFTYKDTWWRNFVVWREWHLLSFCTNNFINTFLKDTWLSATGDFLINSYYEPFVHAYVPSAFFTQLYLNKNQFVTWYINIKISFKYIDTFLKLWFYQALSMQNYSILQHCKQCSVLCCLIFMLYKRSIIASCS